MTTLRKPSGTISSHFEGFWRNRKKSDFQVFQMKSQWISLTPRCRTLKVPKVGTFSWYLRVTAFMGFEIYTQKYMTLRDFDNFFFFAWILCFLCASLHATEFVKKWCKTKWSCFYIIIWAFVILRLFCDKKIIFHNFYVLFPDWYIHETIYNLIFIRLFPD